MKKVRNRTSCKGCGLPYTSENWPRYMRAGRKYTSTYCRECNVKMMADSAKRRRAEKRRKREGTVVFYKRLDLLAAFWLGMVTQLLLIAIYIKLYA